MYSLYVINKNFVIRRNINHKSNHNTIRRRKKRKKQRFIKFYKENKVKVM